MDEAAEAPDGRGHYDVVPAQSPDQFRPRRVGGNLVGRGSSDMKSGLAAMLYAAHALRSAGARLRGRVGLTIVPDEETGGRRGSAYLDRTGRLGKNGIGMLLGEPTSGVVWIGCRGALSLRVRTRGREAHVGLQHQGINAFEKMLPVAQALLELKREVERRATSHAITPAAARHSILLVGGRCEAGSNFNVVPGECTLTVDRRFNPEESLEDERRRLFDQFDRLRASGADLEVEVFQEGHACATSQADPLGRALASAIVEVCGRPPRFELCPGLLEIRFYAARGIPAFAYGPGTLELAHGPRESVRVKRILECARVYALTALDVLGG